MFWKLCGCLSLITAGTLGGIWMAQRVDRRVETLLAVGWMLQRAEAEIRYTRTPTGAIFTELSADPALAKLAFLPPLATAIRCGEEFSSAWERVVREAAPSMQWTGEDLRVILSLSGVLGATDAQSQSEAIHLLQSELDTHLEEAKKNSRTLGRMYRSLGVLAGLGVSLLLL